MRTQVGIFLFYSCCTLGVPYLVSPFQSLDFDSQESHLTNASLCIDGDATTYFLIQPHEELARPSTPQLPFQTPHISSDRDQKALNRGTLGSSGPELSFSRPFQKIIDRPGLQVEKGQGWLSVLEFPSP